MKEEKRMIVMFIICFAFSCLLFVLVTFSANNRLRDLKEDNAKLIEELDKYVDGTYRLQYMDGSGKYIDVVSYKHENGIFTFYLEDYDGALVLTDKQYNDNYIMTFKFN